MIDIFRTTGWKRAASALALGTVAGAAQGQSTVISQDLYPGPISQLYRSVTSIDEAVYFGADDGAHGEEPWVIEPGSSHARLLGDIRPGWQGSRPRGFTGAGDQVFFSAVDPSTGIELFRHERFSRKLGLVKDINPGPGSSAPSWFASLHDRLIFVADDGSSGKRVWVSDGTDRGTFSISDVAEDPEVLTRVGDQVFFWATTRRTGYEPWVTDGTRHGTRMVADIALGIDSSRVTAPPQSGMQQAVRAFHDIDGQAWFLADDRSGVSGPEPWATDGNASGTRLASDLRPGPYGSYAVDLAWSEASRSVVLSAETPATGREPWRLQLDPNGQVARSELFDLNPGPSGSEPTETTAVNGHIVFAADDGRHGREPWGVPPDHRAGPRLLRNVWRGAGDSDPGGFVDTGSGLAFTAKSRRHGSEVWFTDGARAGLLADAVPGRNGSGPTPLVGVTDGVVFQGELAGAGRELYIVSW